MPRNTHSSYKVGTIIWLPLLFFIVVLGVIITMLSMSLLTDDVSDEYSTSTERPQKIIVIGDIACDPKDKNFNDGKGTGQACQQQAIAERIKSENADAILLTGDIQYEQGTVEKFQQSFLKAWPEQDTPFIAAVGNHDYINGALEGYKLFKNYYTNAQAFGMNGETYFATKIGSWPIFSLDTNCEYVGGCQSSSAQGKWLAEQLTATSSTCSLALVHHPVFTAGTHRLPGQTNRGKDIWRQLDNAGVDVLLAGHDHNYQRFAPQNADGKGSIDGMRQFIVGTGGKNLYPLLPPYGLNYEKGAVEFGYLKMLLYREHYSWSFINLDNKVIDTGKSSCR